MKTFRSMALSATIASAALLITGCGGQSDDTADPAPVVARTSAAPTLTTSGPEQSLTKWLPASTGVLRDLSADLSGITASLTAGETPDPTKLTADATNGLDLAAPAGHPDLDRAWDAVMNDYLVVSGDLASGDAGQTSADLTTANADMDTLRAESAKL